MLAQQFSFGECLDNSIKSAWTVDDCFQGRGFDFSKRFLPERLAGVEGITCLNTEEKLRLNQIRGNSYCHIFAFVEEFIVPMVMDHARRDVYGDEKRLRFLLRFAEDETKHQDMLKLAMEKIAEGLGHTCGVIKGREEVAEVVLGKSPLAALLLTSMIEWFTQLHYLEHVRDEKSLDPLFHDILRYHWIDEAQHAKADTLLIDEITAAMTIEEREEAVDELLELGMAVDGLLANQLEQDIAALEAITTRSFNEDEKAEIRQHQQRAYRWTFIVSGLEHPKFVETVGDVTNDGTDKITDAAHALAT